MRIGCGKGRDEKERAIAKADFRHIFAEKLEEKGRIPQLWGGVGPSEREFREGIW